MSTRYPVKPLVQQLIAQVNITVEPSAACRDRWLHYSCVRRLHVRWACIPALNGNPTTGGTWTTSCSPRHLDQRRLRCCGHVGRVRVAPSPIPMQLTGPCPSVSAQVTVTIVDALDAGEDTEPCRPAPVRSSTSMQTARRNTADRAAAGTTWTALTGRDRWGLQYRCRGIRDHVAIRSYTLLGSGGCVPDTATGHR
jgi:hypothetical protein